MIPQKHRHWMLLAGLFLVFVVVVTYQVRSLAPTTSPPPPSNSPAAARAAQRAGSNDVPVTGLKLESLEAARENLPPAQRNPFRFRERPAPPPPKVTAPPPPVAPQPVGPPPPPPIPLRFIGVIEGSPRVGVLSDGRGDVFYGKDGDIIDGRYRILRVGPDSADLSYPDGRGRQTLRLSGQ